MSDDCPVDSMKGEMMDLERLDEALAVMEWNLEGEEPLMTPGQAEPIVFAAARAYQDLANGERVEPDYEAAADWLRRVGLAGVVTDADIEGGFLAMAEETVRVAIGDKLLVDHPTEEE